MKKIQSRDIVVRGVKLTVADPEDPKIYRDGKLLQFKRLGAYDYISDRDLMIPVHRAVALAFCRAPRGVDLKKMFVDHIDSNPLNNQASNLRWVTRKTNNSTSHSIALRRKNCKHEDRSAQLILDQETGSLFSNSIQAAKHFGVTKTAILNGIKKKREGRKTRRQLVWISRDDAERDSDAFRMEG